MRLAAYDCDEHPDAEAPYVAWEETPCLLCGYNASIPFIEAADPLAVHDGLRFLIVRCLHCGLCYTNPRPDPFSIRQFYPTQYSCYHGKPRNSKSRFRMHDPMAALLPLYGQGRLLDFGCGAGGFLQRMHGLGWNVIGLDSADAIVKRIRDQLRLPALTGTLPQRNWDAGSFEAITMWQALEHTHQPLEVLRDAHRLLASGGRLIVTVPNVEGLSSGWFGSNWYGFDVPRHLTHFSAETLRSMLQRAGFAKITLHQEHRGSWMRRSARLAEKRRQIGLLTRLLQTRLASGMAGWWGRWTRRGESLLALAEKG